MRTILAFLLFVLPAVGRAQPAPPLLTVDQAVAQAIRANPRVAAASADARAARAGVRSARALANPSLTFTPAITSRGSDEEVSLLQQPLELNGARRARAGLAGAQLRIAEAEALVTLRDLVFETKAAYVDLARAQDLRSIAAELQKNAEEIDRITRRQVELGSRPGIDQIQTDVELARARQQLITAESRVSTTTASLNTLMGRAVAEPIGRCELPAAAVAPSRAEANSEQALGARAETAAAEALVQARRAEGRLARAEGRPDLIPQFRIERVTRGVAGAGVGVGITLPLIDFGSRRHRVRQAEAAALAQEQRLEATRQQVRLEVAQAVAHLRAAEAVVQSHQAGILEQARRLLDASRTGFQTGATGILAVLEAQRTYRNVLTEYADALAARARAEAEYERATGAVPAPSKQG